MQVQSLECQLAQAQIGRYLAGAAFSGEALEQLEKHIAACESCKSVVDERRATLKSMLQAKQPAPAKAAVQQRVSEPKTLPLINLWKKNAALLQPKPRPEAPTESPKQAALAPDVAAVEVSVEPTVPALTHWKPLALSGALAVVLIGMSLMSRGPTSVFGKRAIEMKPSASAPAILPTTPAAASATRETSHETESTTTTSLASTVSEDRSDGEPAEVTTGPAETRPDEQPVVRRARRREPEVEVQRREVEPRRREREASQPRKQTPPPTRSSESSVKVYDENGNPISN
jgi:hypothetical protein